MSEYTKKIEEMKQQSTILNHISKYAEREGIDYTEMLERVVIFMLETQDDIFKERISKMQLSTVPCNVEYHWTQIMTYGKK